MTITNVDVATSTSRWTTNYRFTNLPIRSPGKADIEAVSLVPLVLLVAPDQHVGEAGLAHSCRAHDHDAWARKPEK